MKIRIIQKPNVFNDGGILNGYHTNFSDWRMPGGFHIIGSGGTHELNKLEGVMLGTDPNGVPNLVEENEVVYNDYVYSDRLVIPKRRKNKDKEISDLAWEEKMLKPYEGKTYAQAAKKIYEKSQEILNDETTRRGFDTILGILALSQEKERAKQEHANMASLITEMSGTEFAQMLAIHELLQQMQEAQAQQQAMQEQEAMQAEQSQQEVLDPQAQQYQEAQQAQQVQQAEQGTQLLSPEEQLIAQQQMAEEQAAQDAQALLELLAIQEQQAQQTLELAMVELAMQLLMLGQQPVAAYGGKLFAQGGDTLEVSTNPNAEATANTTNTNTAPNKPLSAEEYQELFQRIALYATENKDALPELYDTISKIKTQEEMVLFVDYFLASLEGQQLELLQSYSQMFGAQTVLQAPIQSTQQLDVQQPTPQQPTPQEPQLSLGLLYAQGGYLYYTGGKFKRWWNKNVRDVFSLNIDGDDTYSLTKFLELYKSLYGKDIPEVVTKRSGKEIANWVYQEVAKQYELYPGILDRWNSTSHIFNEMTDEQKKAYEDTLEKKATKTLNKRYKKYGIDPESLGKVSKELYKRDLEKAKLGVATFGEEYKAEDDENLAVNTSSLNLKNKEDNYKLYSKSAKVYEVEDYLDKQGARVVNLNEANQVPWDKANGLTAVNYGDASEEDFYNAVSNYTASNGVYDYDPSNRSINSSNFTNQDDMQSLYLLRLSDYYANVYGDSFNRDDIYNYYLNGEQAREWVNLLMESSDPRDRELAEIVKQNWGSNLNWDRNQTWEFKNRYNPNGTVIEADGYLNHPEVQKNDKQKDGLLGIQHVPYASYLDTPASASRYFYTGGNKKKYILKPDNNLGFQLAQTPVISTIGNTIFNDYEVLGLNKNRLLTRLSNGKVYDVTNLANVDKWKQLDKPVLADDTSNLGMGVQGKSKWVELDDETAKDLKLLDDDKPNYFPLPKKWPWYLGLGLLGAATLYNALSPVDYSNANAMIQASRDSGLFMPVSFKPVGDYLAYNPLDRNYEGNKVRSAMAGLRNSLSNLSGGNSGVARANILASDYNGITHLADVDRKAAEANRDHLAKVGEFNKQTNQFNAEGLLKADMANQEALAKAAQFRLEGLAKGYQMRQDADKAKSEAISSGLSGIANTLFGLYAQDYNNSLIKYSIDTDTYGSARYKKDDKPQYSAKGGGIRIRRRKKGLDL